MTETPESRQPEQPRRRRVFLWVLTIAVIIAIVTLAAVLRLYSSASNIRPTSAVAHEVSDSVDKQASGEPTYVLLLGVDRRAPNSPARADTIMVARLDPQRQSLSLLSIPRDTKIELAEHGTQKINAAHAFGGPALSIAAVRKFTGLPIHHYVETDFAGLVDVVDVLGGVWIDVSASISDPAASLDGLPGRIEPGRQLLDGRQALVYARSRKSAGGDFDRIKRQQQLLSAIITQSRDAAKTSKLPELIDALSGAAETDMTVDELYWFFRALANADRDGALVTLPGKPVRIDGVSYVLPNDDAPTLIEQFRAGSD